MTWTTIEGTAAFQSDHYQLQLQLRSPQSGIGKLSYGGQSYPVRPFQLTWRSDAAEYPFEETYTRGNELVVTYELAPNQRVRPQLVWCVTSRSGALAIDLTISMQTPDLDSDPRIQSHTDFPPHTESLPIKCRGEFASQATDADTAFLFRPKDHELSYAELIFPSDLATGSVSWTGDRLSYRLLSEPLEKGVIRKVRIRALVLPRSDDKLAAERAFEVALRRSTTTDDVVDFPILRWGLLRVGGQDSLTDQNFLNFGEPPSRSSVFVVSSGRFGCRSGDFCPKVGCRLHLVGSVKCPGRAR